MSLIAAADQVVNAGQVRAGLWSGQDDVVLADRHACPIARAGTIRRLRVRVAINTLDSAATVRATINGFPTLLGNAIVIPAGTTGDFGEDVVEPVAAGDRLAFYVSPILSTVGLMRWSASFEYIPT